jgi:uncharacterized protein
VLSRVMSLAALATVVLVSGARAQEEPVVRNEKLGEIPIKVISPKETKGRTLIIWLPGFSGSKDGSDRQLRELAAKGYVALSFDPYQHGARRIEEQPELVKRVRGNIRRYFWPILARTAEEVPLVIDWAIKELGVRKEVGIGGVSMGGDISVAAAGVDKRIKAVSACVGTPDWMRPGSFEPPGEPDAAAQADFAIAFQSGADDRQVPAEAGQRFVAALQETYRKHPERLVVNLLPMTAHAFTPAMWEASVKWFETHLPPQK